MVVQTKVSVFCFLLGVAVAAGLKADDAQAIKDAAIVETLLRLPNIDVNTNPKMKAAVTRHLETKKGTPRYLELVSRFKLRDAGDDLVHLVATDPASTLGVGAAKLLLEFKDSERVQKALNGEDEKRALGMATAIGLVANKQAIDFLTPLVTDTKRSTAIRSAAARGLGANRNGEKYLLELVTSKKLPKDLNFVVGDILHASADAAIRKEIAKHIQLPATAAGEPLPPIAQLVKMVGNATRGHKAFSTVGTCANCHIVNKQGKEVGPDLSEIGSKLSRDAMYVSILDPSAGISHNYESYALLTAEGLVISGIKISETDTTLTLKTAKAIVQEIDKEAIEEMKKQDISLMPADLQKALKVQDLVDIVEFMTTLRKKTP